MFIKINQIVLKAVSVITCLFISMTAFASGETPVSYGLKYLTDAMYGATGLAIATISIMVVGLLCLSHVIKWSILGYTIIGISIVFGAGSIVSGITRLIPH